MFIRRFAVVILLCVSSLLCSACALNPGGWEQKISSEGQPVKELVSTIYSESELREIIGFAGTLEELDSRYQVECVRMKENTYRVIYLGEECAVILCYDSEGNKIMGDIRYLEKLKADFEDLKCGQKLDEVMAIDPAGKYLFLETGRDDIPRSSEHCTTDGYLITITYDEQNQIVDIAEELL